jgi:hypothetical protein
MPIYTLQLSPDSLTGLYWVDLGNNTHVELDKRQANQLITLINSSAKLEKGRGMHPPTFDYTDTVIYDDEGQLDTVLGDNKNVKSGVGILDYDAHMAAVTKEVMEAMRTARSQGHGGYRSFSKSSRKCKKSKRVFRKKSRLTRRR